jgi:plasmid stability protein
MTEVRLRDVDPDVVEALRVIARQNGRSMEAEIKEGLVRIANERKAELLARIRAGREELQARAGVSADSTPDIREEREARW